MDKDKENPQSNSDTPQRVKDIIAEAKATYEEIMKLN